MRRLSAAISAAAILAVAIGAGAWLRFVHLGAMEMSADEGASWGAASAPTAAGVIARHAILNPGKLAIHDLALHWWIAIFGPSLPAMRSLSAALGVLSIALVYLVAREMLSDAEGGESRFIAAASALLYATSLIGLKYEREARMYPLVIAALLAQVLFFLRAVRRGGAVNYAALATLSALAIAANFSAILIPATEALWLAYLMVRVRFDLKDAAVRRAIGVSAALAIGCLPMVPSLIAGFSATAAVTSGGILRWIRRPELYAPIALFNKGTGTFAFPILAALAIWGIVRGLTRDRDATLFALLWMWAPPLMMLAASYALTPIFIERYALSCFVPFFILCAIGISELPRGYTKVGALGAVAAISLLHVRSFYRRPHDAQYKEAAAIASASLAPGESMTIVPAYAIEVLHYYLPSGSSELASRYDSDRAKASVLILREQGVSDELAAKARREYPNLIARTRGIEVRRR